MGQIHRFKVDKLVRDKLPQIMGSSGVQMNERVMNNEEYLKRLKDKLLEESQEVMASTCEKEMCEEMADLYEVMSATLKIYGLNFEVIQNLALKKRNEKGGFDNKIYCDYVEIEEGSSHLTYFRDKPDKYPEHLILPLAKYE